MSSLQSILQRLHPPLGQHRMSRLRLGYGRCAHGINMRVSIGQRTLLGGLPPLQSAVPGLCRSQRQPRVSGLHHKRREVGVSRAVHLRVS